jgi:hypothetical protein
MLEDVSGSNAKVNGGANAFHFHIVKGVIFLACAGTSGLLNVSVTITFIVFQG